MTAWPVDILFKASALLLLAAAVDWMLRRRASAAARHLVWTIAIADDAARRLRIRRPVRMLQVDDEVMPFTFGTLRPAIVLPAAASRWPADRRRAVILHELAHVARADCFAQRLATLACALYWPHPGIWWAARRLRIERELA